MGTDDDNLGTAAGLFKMLRTDIGEMRREINERLDKLVSSDIFEAERTRVNDRFGQQGGEIAALKSELAAEVAARTASELAAANVKAAEQTEKQKVQASSRWQWFALVASPVLTALVTWILATGRVPQ